jgi:hypothetical protein
MHREYKKDVEAYADNEMDAKQSKQYEETLNAYILLQNYLFKLEKQKKLLKRWWSEQRHN